MFAYRGKIALITGARYQEEASAVLASSRGNRLFKRRECCGSDDHDGKTGSDETNPSWCTSDDHQADSREGEQRHHRYHEPEETEHILVVTQGWVHFPPWFFSQWLLVY